MAAGMYSERLHVSNFTAQEQHPVSQRQNYTLSQKLLTGYALK